MKKYRIPKVPRALQRAVRLREMAQQYRDLGVDRRQHDLKEQRANIQGELIRLRTTANQLAPGFREHLERQNRLLETITRQIRR